MNYRMKETVLQAALERIRLLFDDFDRVTVSYSGGKDSTVLLELALTVARERNCTPIDVLFIDQEIELQSTIELVRSLADSPEINMLWLQVPFLLSNSIDRTQFNVWGEGEDWYREKEPDSIHENTYGTEHFLPMFSHFCKHHYPEDESVALLGGVRAEESPARRLSLTTRPKYKWITWGKNIKNNNITFYPIYDWSYSDVWKYIHEKDITYNSIYDVQYRHGIPLQKMRVSSLIHETAIGVFDYIKEAEPNIWNKLAERVPAANTQRQLGVLKCPDELPYMFSDWEEYRRFLLDKLITDKKVHASFVRRFKTMDAKFLDGGVEYMRTCIVSIIIGDYSFVKLQNYAVRVSGFGGTK